jgi:putative tricarboxylic transport membrane protein
MKKADRIFGVIGLGLAIWSYLESTRLTYMTEFTPGPGFMPFWVGVILAILSLYLIFDSYMRKPSEKDNAKLLPTTHALLRVGAIMLFLIIATVIMPYLGFPLTLVLLTTTILRLLERYSIVKSIGYGIAYAVVTWFVFEYIMTMGFPKGFLGI